MEKLSLQTLLVGMKNNLANLEKNLKVPQILKNRITIKSINSTTRYY